eukprot:1155361-Pleurochrysis_carterae.AAC.2
MGESLIEDPVSRRGGSGGSTYPTGVGVRARRTHSKSKRAQQGAASIASKMMLWMHSSQSRASVDMLRVADAALHRVFNATVSASSKAGWNRTSDGYVTRDAGSEYPIRVNEYEQPTARGGEKSEDCRRVTTYFDKSRSAHNVRGTTVRVEQRARAAMSDAQSPEGACEPNRERRARLSASRVAANVEHVTTKAGRV